MLTAALDVARLGGRAPLSADLLREAAPGYCTSAQQAEAPENWFEQALAYATEKLHGAAAALAPAGAGVMGQVAGYTVADYLLQHASRERRPARVPASTWDALLSHLRDPDDAARLADSAQGRLLYRYAIPLYRLAADAGDGSAARQLAELLADRGDLDGLRRSCAAPTPGPPPGGWPNCWPTAGTWTGQRRSRAPAPTPATGSPPCSSPSCWPGAGTWTSCAPAPTPATRLPPAAGRSCWPSAATWTSCAPAPTPTTGTPPGCWPKLLAGPRRPGRAARPRRRRRRVRRRAAGRPAGRPRGPGRGRADPARLGRHPQPDVANQLAKLLARRGDWDELRARADAGDWIAARRLAELLAERGDLDELRARADAGDEYAAGQLAELLADRGDLDGAEQILRARADAGDGDAGRLAGLLARRGQGAEAERVRRFGLNPDGSIARG